MIQLKEYLLEEFQYKEWAALQDIVWKESAQTYAVYFAYTGGRNRMVIDHTMKSITFMLEA